MSSGGVDEGRTAGRRRGAGKPVAPPRVRQRNTWLRRMAGLSAGGLIVGLVIGLLLPW